MSVHLGSAHGDIILDGSGVAKGVGQAGASLHQFEGMAAEVSTSFAGFAAGIAKAAAGLAISVGTGVAGMVAVGVKGAADLQQAVANIASIKPDIDTSAVFASLNDISTRVPQSAQQLADGLYNIFSSIEASQADALRLVETFARGAVGAQTDANTFGTAILGVMNAYKLTVADAAHISDVFFNTVNRGVVTGEQLAASLGPVTQSAKAAGVSLDELGALIVGVTKEGGPAAQNINNLNNVLQKITTTDAQKAINDLGVKTVDASGNFRPLIDILSDLKPRLEGMTEAQRANALQTIFPDAQARQGALTLISQLDAVKAALADNQHSAGAAAAAYEKMSATFRAQTALLRNTVVADLRTIGAALLPLGTTVAGTLAQLLRQAQPSIEAFAAQLATVGMAVVQGLARAIPTAISALRLLFTTILAVIGAFRSGDFNRAFGPIISGIEAAFGSRAAGLVTLFVSNALRGLQLVRDAVLTAQQAAAGNWFGGQTEGINAFVRTIGRFTQLARDAFITVRQVFDREWVTSPEIQPLIRAIGEVATAARDLGDNLRPAGAAFAAVFTSERIAILRQFADDLLSVRTDLIVRGLQLLGAVLPPVITGLGRLVGLALDGLGALQATGHEADVLRVALGLLGGVLALNQFADFVKDARLAAGAAQGFFTTITRGPRLVITTIRTIYEAIGTAVNAALNAGKVFVQTVRTVYETVGKAVDTVSGIVTRTVSVVFAGAQDAAIWAQLYAEQATQVITRQIRTIYANLPAPPSIPDLAVRLIPELDTTGIGATLPPLKVNVQPQIQTGISLGNLGGDLVKGLTAGIGAALGGAIVAAVGALSAEAIAVALAAVLVVAAQAAAIYFGVRAASATLNALTQAIAAQGGLGPALAALFLDAIPFALGQAAGLLVNAGLQLALFLTNGLLQGVPALIAAIQTNFQQIITTIGLIFAPLPTLIFGLLQAIGPTLVAFGSQVLGVIGSTFSQIGTIVSTTLGSLGEIVGAAFASILTVLSGLGTQILGAITAALQPIAALIQAIISGDWGAAIQAGLQLLVNLFVVLPAQIIGILAAGFGQVVQIIGESLGAAAGAVGEAFAGIVTAVGQAGSAIVSAVSSAFTTVLTTIATILSNIGQSIAHFLGSYVEGFTSTFNTELPSQVAAGMAQLLTAIGTGISQAVGLIASLPGQVAGAVGDLSGVLFSAGASVIGGLISGIQSQLGPLGNFLGGIGDFIQQHKGPPSEDAVLLYGIGRLIVQGLASGMGDELPTVAKQGAELTKTIAEAAQAGVEALNAIRGLRAPGAAQFAGFATSVQTLVQSLLDVSSQFENQALAAAAVFAESAQKVIALVKPAVEAFAALVDISQPTADALGTFTQGLIDLILSLVQAARLFDADGLGAAVVLAEAAGKIVALIAPAVAAFKTLQSVIQPTADQLGVFTAGCVDLVLSLVFAARLFDSDGLGAATDLADAAGQIIALVAPAVAAFKALAEVTQPTADQLGVFAQGIVDISLSLVNASRLFTRDGLAGATALADAALKILALVAPAIAAFKALPGIMQPTGSQLGVLTAGIVDISLSLVNAGRKFTTEGLAGATALADAALKILSLIKPAIEGFRLLPSIVGVSSANVATFQQGVVAITTAIVQAGRLFAAEALTHAQLFADTAAKSIGLIGSGVTAFKALNAGDFALPDASRLGLLVQAVRQTVIAVGEAARTVAADLVTQAAEFADGAGKSVALVGGAISAFANIADFVPPSPAQIDALKNAILLTVRRVADAAREIDAESVKVAGEFSDSASKAVGLIGGAISAFTIKTNVDKDGNAKAAERLITTAEIDQLVALTRYAVGQLIGVARSFDKGQLAQLATFADAASKGFGALRGILDSFTAVTKDKTATEGQVTPQQAIEQMITLFTAGIGRLNALAVIATQYRTIALTIRQAMSEAGTALAEALGGLSLPQGVTPQTLALATGGGAFTIRQEVVHTFSPVQFSIMGENGPWIVRSLQIDGKSRTEVAGMVADALIAAAPAGAGA